MAFNDHLRAISAKDGSSPMRCRKDSSITTAASNACHTSHVKFCHSHLSTDIHDLSLLLHRHQCHIGTFKIEKSHRKLDDSYPSPWISAPGPSSSLRLPPCNQDE